MRIVIAGAGIGGLTLALALARRGLRPLILERSPILEAAGAGVQLGPNATRLLIGMGLESPLRAVSVAPLGAEVHDGESGRLRLRMQLGEEAEARWGAPYLQLHRADLQAVLLDAVTGRDAAEIRLGVAVVAVETDGVLLADGLPIPADVIVGADGVRSVIRGALGGPDPLRRLNETAWRALIPAEGGPAAARVWAFPRKHLVAYPVSGGRALNLVAVAPGRLDGGSWVEPGEPDALRQAFAGADGEVRDLLAQVTATSRWALADMAPLSRWTDGRLVLLGDAAHAMAPYLAQGAAMAIEDAEALARHLAGPFPCPGQGDVADRLTAYQAERKPRAERVQAASRRNGRVFHLPGALSTAAFAAARAMGGGATLDWLYGYRPPVQ